MALLRPQDPGLMAASAAGAPAGTPSPSAAPVPGEVGTRSLSPVEQQQADYYDYDLPEKQSWPELVGKPAPQAKSIIEAAPGVKEVFLVQMGSATTDDYVPTRVRIFFTPQTDNVAKTPLLG